MTTPDTRGFEPKENKNQRFEALVKRLVEKSALLPEKQLTASSKLDIITAVENNDVSTYVGSRADGTTLDAVHCLTAIYDELGKDEPDEDFIRQTVEQLKGYM